MSENKVLASVNGKEITEGIVMKFLNDLGPQVAMQFRSPDGIKRVVQELINQEIVYLDAIDNKLDEDEAFNKELDRLKEGLLKQYALNNILSKVTVSEGEILKYYNENKNTFVKPETAQANHILVESLEKAKEVLEKIEEGMEFEDAAKVYSTCPSGEQGGSLGEFARGQMVPEFEEIAFKMEENTISKPVKTQFGYHIIKLISLQEEKLNKLDEVKGQINQQLLGMKQQEVYIDKVNQLKGKYKVINHME